MTTTSEDTLGFLLSDLRCAAGTDVGMRRDENQDSFGVLRKPTVHGYFIADGMGGVHGGATASRLAVTTLEQGISEQVNDLSVARLREIVQQINLVIFEAGGKDPSLAGMGTTLVGVVFTPQSSFWVNVGDSRLYRVRKDSIAQISEDHTLVRELVRSGAIKPEEAEAHPVSHMLTRSLGPLERVEVDCFSLKDQVREGDILVLCSDGLYNFVSDTEILGVVRQNSIDDANQILINLANKRGGADNITVLVIAVGQTGRGGRTAEFRKARDASQSLGADVSGTAQDKARSSSESGTAIPEPLPPSQPSPPFVKEPLRARSKRIPGLRAGAIFPARSLPVPLLVIVALGFGLVAGDGARKVGRSMVEWLSGRDLASAYAPSAPEAGQPDTANPLERISSDLQIERTGSSGDVSLPEIARQVQSASLDQALRQRRERIGRERLLKARDFFQLSVKKLEGQVAMFSAGSIPSPDVVTAANKDADEVQLSIDQVELQIDAASRKLSQWYGRQKRLEEQDPLKIAAEVGASSESVKGKKSEFEFATYEYIKKRDEVELYPADEKLAEQLILLKDKRTRLLRELQDAVRRTVEEVLLTSNEHLEDLKLQREMANLQLQALKQDLEIAKVVVELNSSRREAMRDEVIARLQSRQSALAVIKGALGSDDSARIRQALALVEGISAQEEG
jgi:serine/threonine protein phosphatase PrpC